VVECARLEIWFRCKPNVGSNPTLSASSHKALRNQGFFVSREKCFRVTSRVTSRPAMRIPHYLYLAPSGVWHFRQRIPARRSGMQGCGVVRRSLRTNNLLTAQRRALDLLERYAQAFASGGGNMTKDRSSSVEDVLGQGTEPTTTSCVVPMATRGFQRNTGNCWA
jgi:hypothetical protein